MARRSPLKNSAPSLRRYLVQLLHRLLLGNAKVGARNTPRKYRIKNTAPGLRHYAVRRTNHHRKGRADKKDRLQLWKDVTAVVQSAATVLALAIGAVWTYMIFIQDRQNKPALDVSQVVQQFCMPDNMVLLSVKEVLKNSSLVKVELESGQTWVVPIPVASLEKGDADNSRSDKAADWANWPAPRSMVSIHQWDGSRRFIEPKESDIFENHFLVPNSTGLVSIMTFVANKTAVANPEEKDLKKRQFMSWSAITDYDVQSTPCPERSSKKPQ